MQESQQEFYKVINWNKVGEFKKNTVIWKLQYAVTMKRKKPKWINSELVWVQIFQLEGHSFLDKNIFLS